MKKVLLTVALAAETAFSASALSDTMIKRDLTGHDAWQSESESTFDPKNALDGKTGNPMSGWNNGELAGEITGNILTSGANWWLVDLGEGAVTDAVKIYFEGAFATSFDIEFFDTMPESDAVSAASTISVTNNGTAFEYEFDSTQRHRYMRLNFTGATNAGWGIKFYEVETYSDAKKAASANLINPSVGRTYVIRDLDAPLRALFYDGDKKLIGVLDGGFNLSTTAGNAEINGTTLKAAEYGDIAVDLELGGKNFGTTVFKVVPSISDCSNVIYNYGPWKATITDISPAEGFVRPEQMTDSDKETNGGWSDGKLGTEQNLATPATFTLNLGRPCTVSALRLVNEDATITGYTIELLNSLGQIVATTGYSTNNTANYSVEEIYFEDEYADVTDVRFNVTSIKNPAWGGRFREIEVYGRGNEEFSLASIELLRRNVNIGQTVDYAICGVTEGGLRTAALSDATLTLDDETSLLILEGKKLTGIAKGLVPVILSWTDPNSSKVFTVRANIEVTTADWTNEVNIARRFATLGLNNMDTKKNGIVFKRVTENATFFYGGNPLSSAFASGSKGAKNESVRDLIDGDWMAWTITEEEMAAETKPSVTIDLGYAFPIDEFDIHWNADAQGDWGMMSGNYKVYGSANGTDWTNIYTVEGRPVDTYDVDRHVFAEGTYRYVKFEFLSPKVPGHDIAINEIVIGGSKFKDAEGNLIAYPDANVLKIVTPRFDRSNLADRASDNDWIVTNAAVSEKNPLNLSYMARDCYGREFMDERQDVKIFSYNGDNRGDELAASGNTVNYRDVSWPAYPYSPEAIGSKTFRAVAGDLVSDPFTVYTISDRGNVNRYAYAYDNARNYSENWENEEGFGDRGAGTATGDRDLSNVGTSPQNAADGNWGSWYAVGYFGPGDHMGQTYKYPANWTLGTPYELVMDYRGIDHDQTNVASRFASKLDMIGIQYEGAFARDYDVYLLHCDPETGSTEGYGWEQVAAFSGLTPMGVGQVETQRIYPADEDGTPILWESDGLDEDGAEHKAGQVKAWINVAAVKIVLKTTGTQWGIKMMESALYGKLNKTILPLDLTQRRFGDAAATEPKTGGAFHSFDFGFTNNYDASDYVDAELKALTDEIKNVDSYDVELIAQEVEGDGWKNVVMTAGTAPTDVLDASGNVVTTTLSEEGTLLFSAKPDADHMLNGYVIRNANPAFKYILKATPKKDGEVFTAVEINNSKRSEISVPALKFTPVSVSMAPVTEVLDVTSLNGTPMALGATDAHKAHYVKANVVSLNGTFEALNVTDAVLNEWNVGYQVGLKLNGSDDIRFNQNFDKNLKLNARHQGVLSNMPLATETKTAGELFADDLADAPVDIREQQFSVFKAEQMTVEADAKAFFSLGERNGESVIKTETKDLTTDGLAERITAATASDAEYAKGAYVPTAKAWDAFVTLPVEDADKNLHSLVGFFATSADHADHHANGTSAEGFFHGGYPIPNSANDLDDKDFGMSEFDAQGGADNFGYVAHDSGSLSFGLTHFSTAPAKEELTEDTNVDIYALVTNEYPVVLAPVADGALAAAPSLSFATVVDGQSYAAEAAGESMSVAEGSAPSIQAVVVPSVKKVTVNLYKDVVNAIDNIYGEVSGSLSVYPNPAVDNVRVSAADSLGEIEIFTLDGRRVVIVESDAATTTINVSQLTSGVYLMRAAGTTIRLVKI